VKITTIAAGILGLTMGLMTPMGAEAQTPNRPHWIPNAMELQQELREEGYIVVWGEDDSKCESKVLPQYKTVVVCGQNPIGDLRDVAWQVRTGNIR